MPFTLRNSHQAATALRRFGAASEEQPAAIEPGAISNEEGGTHQTITEKKGGN